jgi:hypothetical protein
MVADSQDYFKNPLIGNDKEPCFCYESFGFERDGPDHDLVVQGCKCCSNEWSYPEDPLQQKQN